MSTIRIHEDIRPLSEFRAGVAAFVKQVHETKRPLILTQRGRGVAVLVDVEEFQSMQERLEILEDIYRAEEEVTAGECLGHEAAKALILSRIDR